MPTAFTEGQGLLTPAFARRVTKLIHAYGIREWVESKHDAQERWREYLSNYKFNTLEFISLMDNCWDRGFNTRKQLPYGTMCCSIQRCKYGHKI